jgi:hypothetical protein
MDCPNENMSLGKLKMVPGLAIENAQKWFCSN